MNKYCTLYIARHGQTVWNTKKLFQGHKDSPLTVKGIKQAKNLAQKLKEINFNKVYSSDLLRAKRTAEIIALEKKLAIQTTQLLRERYMGKYEGKPIKFYEKRVKQTIKDLKALSKKQRLKFKLEPDLESDEEVIGRTINFLREISAPNLGKNILIVTHGGVIRNLLIHLGYGDYQSLGFGTISNTAYIKLLSDGIDFFIKEAQGVKLL